MTDSRATLRIAWKVHKLEPSIASVRYRCLLPVLALQKQGVESSVFEQGETVIDIERFAALVFVKSFTDSDLALARRAKRRKVRVILDLCDNVLVSNYNVNALISPTARFSAMAEMADAIVVSTDELGVQISHCVKPGLGLVTIPDQLETPAAVARLTDSGAMRHAIREGVVPSILTILPAFAQRSLSPRLQRWSGDSSRVGKRIYSALRRAAFMPAAARRAIAHPRSSAKFVVARFARTLLRWAEHSPVKAAEPARVQGLTLRQATRPRIRKRVIWFGLHGAPHSRFGIASLADLVPVLADIDQVVPIELRVVSNSEAKFRALAADLPFPATYAAWTVRGIFEELEQSDVCVIPNPLDPFSICKSANRAVLALSMGVPVVATRLPAFAPLANCVVLDDWSGGLVGYLTDNVRRERDLARAREVIDAVYAADVVARQWIDLLSLAPSAEASFVPGHDKCLVPTKRKQAASMDSGGRV